MFWLVEGEYCSGGGASGGGSKSWTLDGMDFVGGGAQFEVANDR